MTCRRRRVVVSVFMIERIKGRQKAKKRGKDFDESLVYKEILPVRQSKTTKRRAKEALTVNATRKLPASPNGSRVCKSCRTCISQKDFHA
jgi:hypothetical protein